MARVLDLEPVLVSREHLMAVEAIQKGLKAENSIPAYQLDKEDDDD
jgi:hypothetical protein